MKIRSTRLLLACLLMAVVPGAGDALAISLRVAPSDTLIAEGEPLRVSIVIDEMQDVRTIEAYVDFDPTVVESIDGGPGALFTDPGFLLFQGFEESAPGQWHGYVVSMGPEYYAVGPGELFVWEIAGLAPGTSPVTSVRIDLADAEGNILAGTELLAGQVTVGYQGAGVPPLPNAQPQLHVGPNPFNPRAILTTTLNEGGPVRLDVFDARGRRVARLDERVAPAGPLRWVWDGHDGQGRLLPGGVYLFRLETRHGQARARAVLLK